MSTKQLKIHAKLIFCKLQLKVYEIHMIHSDRVLDPALQELKK